MQKLITFLVSTFQQNSKNSFWPFCSVVLNVHPSDLVEWGFISYFILQIYWIKYDLK